MSGKSIKILSIFCFIFFTTYSFSQIEKTLTGKWETEEKDGIFEFFSTEKELYAIMIYGSEMRENDGALKKDLKNPDKNLRNRYWKGSKVIGEFKKDSVENQWIGGWIYDFRKGKYYRCQILLENEKLELRGYVGIPLFGKSIYLHRYQGNAY